MILWIAKLLISQQPGMGLTQARKTVKAGLIVVGAIVLGIVFLVWLNARDRAAVDDYKAGVEATAAPAREKAADERVADVIADANNERDLHIAIDAAPPMPDGPAKPMLSPAAHALACERLRKLGRIPAACRSPNGYRIQTNSQ